ncbi:hypothetical protein ACX93W_05490 [Paenibacillus sp. CAU 1782]
MRYSNILSDAIISSGWTYGQIADKCEKRGGKISRSYISKLCTGHMPPASDEVNKILTEVLAPVSDITYTQLAVAKYKEVVPKDIIEALVAGM